MDTAELLLYQNISQVVTLSGVSKKGGRNTTEEDLATIENGAVVVDGNTQEICWIGTTQDLPPEYKDLPHVKSCQGYVWLPELVECHSHLIYAGPRHHDYALRVKGKTYQEVAAEGGGIASTLKHTREASKDQLMEQALSDLDRFQKYGIGTVEAKSGYGLTLEQEIKLLECVEGIRDKTSVNLVSTFMPAHMTPPEFKGRTEEYVSTICKEWIPEVAKLSLAEFFDVFVEDGYFSLAQTRKLCETAKEHGFKIKLHVDQFTDLGGTALAAELGATSADHLDNASAESVKKMAASDCVAVLLPGASLYTGTPYPPARSLLDQGARVALSTDFNPGTCPSRNLPLMTTLACSQMRMSVAEAIVGVTYNAAAAVGMENEIGSLEVGKQFRVCQFRGESYEIMPYCFGELG